MILARRILEGEHVDLHAPHLSLHPEIRRGLERLQQVMAGLQAKSTEEAPSREAPAPPPVPRPPPPKRDACFIGDFRLVRTLGEGGMGVVYEAEQQHPRRPVALKVIRGAQHAGSDTLKLFQREAQTLARLRHPGIAALYETGVTDDGLHFFAMELVRGPTLSAWIRQRPAGPLSPEEVRLRLSVFKKVCDAVAYAHQRGVIHRDLKPGNVLISKGSAAASFQDPVPEVKVLDFGLARITDSDVQATTFVTEMGKVQGTLPYMSPEQVRGNPDEIDLRTDVYSLGVLLYEMVTGRLPYDVSKAQLPEAMRIICEEAPKSITATFSGTRHLHPDVITIAGKCLEKDPARRYQSAATLGEDVGRHLSDQPILARPPSATYQLRKLVARHKGPFALAATVFVLVTVLAITSTVQAVRISRERDRANQEAETAKQISGFLEGLFKVADPSEARGNTITAKEILESGADRIERELRDQPLTQARLMGVMGRVHGQLALYDRSASLITGGLHALKREGLQDSLEYARLLDELGHTLHDDGEYEQARGCHVRALALNQRLAGKDSMEAARSLYFLGTVEGRLGRFDEGLAKLGRALSLAERQDPTSELVIWCLNDLALWNQERNHLQEAVAYYERALELRRRTLPTDHPDLFNGLNNLAWALAQTGELARARALSQEALSGVERVLGAEHPAVAQELHTMAGILVRQGDDRGALPLLQRALAIQEKHLDPLNLDLALTCEELAPVQARVGETAAAESLWRRALDIRMRVLQPDHPSIKQTRAAYASFLRTQGRVADAARVEAGK
ncbi:MAG TPA: serine/threonine-protein kinase [Candidatus Polarisedimenticolaceae bacterium]|nr:serine/threonine-protein kinase [Candidatus Polarisedimenticolaceae bacterium]